MTLQRRTPLARSPLPRGGPLRRVAKMKATSDRRRTDGAARTQLARRYAGVGCRLATPVCTGRAQHLHELVGRAQGGSILDVRNLVPAADVCNSWVEDHPAEAYTAGWKVRRFQAIPGFGGLIPATPHPLAIGSDL